MQNIYTLVCAHVRTQPSPPLPPQPPATGFQLKSNGSCLTLTSAVAHTPVVAGDCGGGSKWEGGDAGAPIASVLMPNSENCLKVWAQSVGTSHTCDAGVRVTVAACGAYDITFRAGQLVVASDCKEMCAVPSEAKDGVANVVLTPCTAAASVWTKA